MNEYGRTGGQGAAAGTKKPRHGLRILALLLAGAVLAGVPAAFAVYYYRECRAARQTAEELDRARSSIRTLEDRLAGAEASLAALQTPEPEPTGDPFQPDHPAYQDLYPDFYAPQPLDASQKAENVIYLTFDDGPSDRTDEVLAALAEADVKATFFVVGQTKPENIQRMRDIAAQGHTLGMHSWSHDYKTIYASVEAFLEDMYRLFVLIRDETGVTPTFFRFPGGSINSYDYGVYEEIMAEMLRRGFVPCDWNLSAQDATSKPLPVKKVISNVMRGAGKSRGVVLMHDSAARTTTVQALPELIRQLREAGYSFAALTPEVRPVLFGYQSIK